MSLPIQPYRIIFRDNVSDLENMTDSLKDAFENTLGRLLKGVTGAERKDPDKAYHENTSVKDCLFVCDSVTSVISDVTISKSSDVTLFRAIREAFEQILRGHTVQETSNGSTIFGQKGVAFASFALSYKDVDTGLGPTSTIPFGPLSSPKPIVTALSASSEGFARRLVCLVQDSKDIERCEVYLRVHVFAPRADDAKVGFGSKLQIRDFLASNKNVSTSAPSRSGQGSLTMYSKARKGLLHSVRGMRSSQTKLSIHAPGGGKDTFDGWL